MLALNMFDQTYQTREFMYTHAYMNLTPKSLPNIKNNIEKIH